MIEELKIDNYKGLNKCEIKELSDINIFTGKNGAGKSSILELISRIINSEYIHDGIVIDEKEYTNRIKIDKLNYEKLDSFKSWEYVDNIITFNENEVTFKKHRDSGELDYIYFNMIDIDNVINTTFTTPSPNRKASSAFFIKQGVIIDISQTLHKSFYMGNNFYSNKELKECEKNINSTVYNDTLKELKKIDCLENICKTIEKHPSKIINLMPLSDGEKQILKIVHIISCIKYKISPSNNYILLEEPETNLESINTFNLVNYLISEVKEINKNMNHKVQVFISTHSGSLINNAISTAESDELKIYHIVDRKMSKAEGYSNQDTTKEFQNINNQLGYNPSNYFLADKIIWVEGITDKLYIEFWLKKYLQNIGKNIKNKYTFCTFGGSQLVNYSVENTKVIEFKSESKSNKETFDFISMDSRSIIIFDNDKINLLDLVSEYEEIKERLNPKTLMKDILGERNKLKISREDLRKKFNLDEKEDLEVSGSKFEEVKLYFLNQKEIKTVYNGNLRYFTIECYREDVKFIIEDNTLVHNFNNNKKKEEFKSYYQTNENKNFENIFENNQRTKEELINELLDPIINFLNS